MVFQKRFRGEGRVSAIPETVALLKTECFEVLVENAYLSYTVFNGGDAKVVIVCNFDDKTGYAGVPNPLYEEVNRIMMLDDAKETVSQLIESF